MAGMSMVENSIWEEMKAQRHGASSSLHLMWVTSACLVSCQGISVFRAGEAMVGGLGNRARRAEDEC